jgi:hypothetical protein
MHDLVRRKVRWSVDKKVDMIRHDLLRQDVQAKFFCFFFKQSSEILFHLIFENLSSSPGNPDKVVVEEKQEV